MYNKGFTLAEVLGVIVLLSLLAAISFSGITNRLNNSKQEISEAQETLILNSAELYVNENRLIYEKKEGNVYCILVESLIEQEYLSSPILDISGEEIDYKTKVKVVYLNDKFQFTYNPDECTEVK